MRKVKNILTGVLLLAVMALPASAAAKNKYLSGEAVSKMQVKKLISGKQDAIKRVATTFDFYTDSIYDVYVTPDFVTMIKFEPDENIVAVIGGDNTNFEMEQEFGGSDNSIYLFIRPTDIDITSNVNVMTNKRIYMFNLYSTLEIFNPLVKFNYPAAGNVMKATVGRNGNRLNNTPDNKNGIMVDIDKMDSNYSISNRNLPFAPKQVFTDGVKTIIIMPKDIQEAPVIMVKGVGSKEFEVVNFEYEFNKIIVHRRITEAVLKLGNKQVIIKHR